MKENNLKWFFEKRKLRKIPFDKEKVMKSLSIADVKLKEAKKLFSSDFFGNSLLSAYTSMFHSARALLYNDGVQEKSHYATYFYVKEKFSGKISKGIMVAFNAYRDVRHELLYGYSQIAKEDSKSALLDAENFLKEVKKILENGN